MDCSSQRSDGIQEHDARSHSPRAERAAEIRLRDRLLANEAGAAEEFCSNHIGPLTAYVRSRGAASSHDVEDVVQETMVRALACVGSFSGRSSLHTWLCAIAHNVRRELERDRSAIGRCTRLDSARDLQDPVGRAADAHEPDAEQPGIAVAGVARLPSKYRLVLLAYYFERRSLKQIAAEAGQGVGAAKALLHRARRALRRLARDPTRASDDAAPIAFERIPGTETTHGELERDAG